MKCCVANTPPELYTGHGFPERLLEIFAAGAQNSKARPFVHQAEAFHRILADEQLLLVAGTASGKTLAVGAPLLYKLEQQSIHKVLLMYPTLALLEDQRRVMDLLAKATGLSQNVGELRGGMSRSALIHALNKPVILATPDEVYWFFRKNVKYSGLLVYGLCQVDEFVLDEAHLFNGLMLRNFEHLWQRIITLAGCLNSAPRLHILTATPTEELRKLNGATPIQGKSKCYDVEVEFQPSGPFGRADQFANAVEQVLDQGQRKVLLVCNSARMAHQLFERYKVNDVSTIPVGHRLKFGRVSVEKLTKYLKGAELEKEAIDLLSDRLLREEQVVLGDLRRGTTVQLALQDVVGHTTEVLEHQCWLVKRSLWERAQKPGEIWESVLNNRPLPCRIVAALRRELECTAEVARQREIVDEWLANTLEILSNISADPISCTASEFADLTNVFVAAGMDKQLASSLVRRLTFRINVDPSRLSGRNVGHRLVYLRWLESMLGQAPAANILETVKRGLESGDFEVECRHVGLWRGLQVPIVVYSGSMAKPAREGLISLFAELERAVLISTSAVEVGVDFHADVLVTEECEGKAFLQRLGRVGRHERGSKVIALVSGDVYAALSELDGGKVSREEFAGKIARSFPQRNYASASALLDATHYLVNEQLGRIGERLNATPELVAATPIAHELRRSEIELAFGLRSTMPQVALRDKVAKGPFYLLRYLDDDDLQTTDSPFEVARARTWFTSLIFQRAKFDVTVNLAETLKASRHALIWTGSGLHVWSHPGAGLQYLRTMKDHFNQAGTWNKWQPGNFLLLYGDVYLSRTDRDLEIPYPEPVRDREQNPLFIPAQTYLVLSGWTEPGGIEELLKKAGVADWEELHYDWDGLKVQGPCGMVVLERSTGASFAAYKNLVDYAHRQVQS